MPLLNGIKLGIQFKAIYSSCRELLSSGTLSTRRLLAGAKAKGHEFTILAKPVHPKRTSERLNRMNEHALILRAIGAYRPLTQNGILCVSMGLATVTVCLKGHLMGCRCQSRSSLHQ